MDGRPRRIKKFAFTIVCVYNRLRVDGARNSTFSQYREHEVRYKKYTEDIVNMATLHSM